MSFNANLYHIQYSLADDTDGGALANGVWTTRIWNTEVVNNITGASLASDQITLPTGTFYIQVNCSVFNGSFCPLRIRNITDSTTEHLGTYPLINNSDNSTGQARMGGLVTIAASKVFEIQQYSTLSPTNGQGNSLTTLGENSLWGDLYIWERL